jgi:peptide/nickel transport system ATP-binding protein
MSETASLEVSDLRITYGVRAVVDGVSFTLARGECLGIIGESGAGKSQALQALLGLLPPQAQVAGEAKLGDANLLKQGASRLRGRRVAMIFQDPMTSLTPHLTVGDQVAEPLVVHRGLGWAAARARAGELLEQVQLSDVGRRLAQYPHELSGGMRQRVAIAMALACDPDFLLADEPTTALDVSVQAQILALLRELVTARNLGLAIVTHDMGVIAALADRVIVMRAGKVLESGGVSSVLQSPTHEYTRALLAATPRLDARGPAVEGVGAQPPALVVRGAGVVHALRGGWGRRRSLEAVSEVSLELAPGEALGVVGESGSGKSSLVRALLRLGPLTSGSISWLGRETQALEGEELRQLRSSMQIVFQDPFASLDPRMSVLEIVAEPLRAQRPELDAAARRVRVLAMLASVGLGNEHAERRSSELSGGQCQRVAIARAMILDPKLLVCDEAVSALDVSIQAQILALLVRLKQERGTSILFVSHNLAVVRQLCERVLVMYLGKAVEQGPTEAVFTAPAHPYTRMLLAAVPLIEPDQQRQRLNALAKGTDTPSVFERPSGCAYHQRCAAAADICRRTSPEPDSHGESRQVACHRWRELSN